MVKLAGIGLALALVCSAGSVSAQTVAKYGAAFLEGGVGARALGMGGAAVALTGDVSSTYWNVAGLSRMQYPEAAYMHAERFSGIVSFDYGAVAIPINGRSTFGIAFFRSGVDDIPNTWDAWDPIRDQPKPRPENYISLFSATDFALYTSYSRLIGSNFSFGFTGKMIRRSIGSYQRAWGYSLDLGVQYQTGRFLLGANLQDASTMLLSWSVNESEVQPLAEVFGLDLPSGGSEIVLPVLRVGSGMILPLSSGTNLTLGFDTDFRFDGRRAYVLDAGGISYHPRLGAELSVKNAVALRAGIGDVAYNDDLGLQLTPAVGAGLNIKEFEIDYAFGDFTGLSSDLGFSHRLSLKITMEQQKFRRTIR